MTDWKPYLAAPALPPTPALLAELGAALRSPDPVLRDEQAFTLLARWVPESPEAWLRPLGDELADRLTDREIQARSFAALVLARLVRRGMYEERWLTAFRRWYPAEGDLRGHDPELGWLHAVAHGADLLGEFGRCARVAPTAMLELAAARLLAPTAHVFDAMEDDRLGAAIAMTLTRGELTAEESVAWLAPIEADFLAGEPGPVPAYASNAMRTLRVVYLSADLGVRPAGAAAVGVRHPAAVKTGVAGVLRRCAPYLG
ncbi:hypothetical protein CFP65_4001 [Kitasatospora sp. MMS16-BH015]|uniref:DUF2785 domain-containing protein n=1 Tax=Kitasatospora sp. MMS16-BH015 TaxID=2018025 RepID=UPI000CA39B28|nr:DUF2785 domain-containing protein [Kitasatospora sp. MMS16-BH015]AUG78770.1 hypothetical protein CFP65_4001 [Kitasatospora sp. MMS16-BH015]